jgi:hypothetical protein
VSFVKIGSGSQDSSLERTYTELRLRVYRDTVRYFEAAERLGTVYVPLLSALFEILYCYG